MRSARLHFTLSYLFVVAVDLDEVAALVLAVGARVRPLLLPGVRVHELVARRRPRPRLPPILTAQYKSPTT